MRTSYILLFSLLTLCSSVAFSATPTNIPMSVVDGDWNAITDSMPTLQFATAHQSFVNHDWVEAATYIEKAATYTGIEAQRAADGTADKLKSAASNLHELATKVKTGAVREVHALDAPFADAHQALSEHFNELAASAHSAEDDIAAGNYLEKAADHLRAAAVWSGNKLDDTMLLITQEAKAAGSELAKGSRWVVTKSGQLISDLGEAIQKAGKKH